MRSGSRENLQRPVGRQIQGPEGGKGWKLELGTREPMQIRIGFRAAGSPPDLACLT